MSVTDEVREMVKSRIIMILNLVSFSFGLSEWN